MMFDVFLLVIVLILFIFIIKNKPELLLLLIWILFFPILLEAVSIIAINKGLYVSELNTVTYYNNSAYIYLISSIVFLLCFYFCLRLNNVKYKKLFSTISMIGLKNDANADENAYIYINFSYILVAYLYIDLVVHGIPLFNNGLGLKLQYFAITAHFPLISLVYSIVCLYTPAVMGLSLLLFKRNKLYVHSIYLLALLSLFYAYLIGFKVSGIDIILYLLFIPTVISVVHRNGIHLKINLKSISIFIGIAIIVGLFILGIFYNYNKTVNGNGSISLIDFFLQRTVGLSNHLLWAAKNSLDNTSLTISQAFQNLISEFSAAWVQPNTFDPHYGVAKLMTFLAPSGITDFYLKNGVRMGGSYITVFYFNCGLGITLILSCIFAILFEKFIRIYVKAISRKSILEVLMATKIMYSFYSFLWNSGSIVDFFSIANIVIILILVFLQYFKPLKVGFRNKNVGSKNEKIKV